MARLASYVYNVTQDDKTKVAVRLQLPPDGTRSHGINWTEQQPQN